MKPNPLKNLCAMPDKLKIRLGNSDAVLTKSTRFVGVKRRRSRGIDDNIPDPEINNIIHSHLGGFEVIDFQRKRGANLNKKLDDMRASKEIDSGTHVYYINGSKKPVVPTGSIYIAFHPGITEQRQNEILAQSHLEIKQRRSPEKLVARVTAESLNPLKCAALLQTYYEVKSAEPDLDAEVEHYYEDPTARYWGQMWHLINVGTIPDSPTIQITPGADAKVKEAWELLDGYGNPNIVVAIIDNGMDIHHPDLRNKIVKPYDCWDNSPNVRMGDPTYTHGTPCASVAIAPANGGMVGAAPVARFMPVSGTSYSIEGTETMFNYVMNNGADVVSCSWGTVDPNFQLNQDKIDAITKAARHGRNGKGCVICFAAGNEGVSNVNFYATVPDVICVAASTSEDEHPDYSNLGMEVTISSPSNGGFYPIFAARASWDKTGSYYGDDIDRGPLYQHFGGTSSATPLAAGICALMLSANPELTAGEVKQILIKTADKIGPPGEYDRRGHSIRFGYGRINAAKAVAEALRHAGSAVSQPIPHPQPTDINTIPITPTQPVDVIIPTPPSQPDFPQSPVIKPAPSVPTTPTNTPDQPWQRVDDPEVGFIDNSQAPSG